MAGSKELAVEGGRRSRATAMLLSSGIDVSEVGCERWPSDRTSYAAKGVSLALPLAHEQNQRYLGYTVLNLSLQPRSGTVVVDADLQEHGVVRTAHRLEEEAVDQPSWLKSSKDSPPVVNHRLRSISLTHKLRGGMGRKPE